jgi:hypothetical protein
MGGLYRFHGGCELVAKICDVKVQCEGKQTLGFRRVEVPYDVEFFVHDVNIVALEEAEFQCQVVQTILLLERYGIDSESVV